MFHLTLMGGSQIRLKEQDNIVVTVWGGTEILMPTLAEKTQSLTYIAGRGLISAQELEDLKLMLDRGASKPVPVQERLRSLLFPQSRSLEGRGALSAGPLNFSRD